MAEPEPLGALKVMWSRRDYTEFISYRIVAKDLGLFRRKMPATGSGEAPKFLNGAALGRLRWLPPAIITKT
jgi:hypothetical protein